MVSKKRGKKRGAKASTTTDTIDGKQVSNSEVIKNIEDLFKEEFVDYGYIKVTYYLRLEKNLLINHKKVQRLMREHGLLNTKPKRRVGTKQWVKELLPKALTPLTYWEFDIKFMYLHGDGTYIPLLTVIDVNSRWVLGHMFKRSIKKEDVKRFFDTLIASYVMPEKIVVRCDNGSQFESGLVREFLASKQIQQEFTLPATPEQNAHIESYHSVLARAVCRRFEFENFGSMEAVLQRWVHFYNERRIHSGLEYTSPYKYLLSKNINMKEKYFLTNSNKKNIFIPLNEK